MASITSLFAEVEDEIVADAEAAWAKVEVFYTDEVKPIMKATALYIENNGAADLLTIAKRVVSSEIATLMSGGNPLEGLAALAGTVWDEMKSASQEIEAGAAHLATAMAFADVSTSAAAPPATGTGTPASPSAA